MLLARSWSLQPLRSKRSRASGSLDYVVRSTDRLYRCGVAVEKLSFHAGKNIAPSNPGTKHLRRQIQTEGFDQIGARRALTFPSTLYMIMSFVIYGSGGRIRWSLHAAAGCAEKARTANRLADEFLELDAGRRDCQRARLDTWDDC